MLLTHVFARIMEALLILLVLACMFVLVLNARLSAELPCLALFRLCAEFPGQLNIELNQ
jgi:hypothetical protein